MSAYLQRYAEPEVQGLAGLPGLPAWSDVLVVPARRESGAFLQHVPPGEGRVLVIVVINQPPDADAWSEEANRLLMSKLMDSGSSLWTGTVAADGAADMRLVRPREDQRDLLLVDRFSPGREIPTTGGVGFARKIGADLATALMRGGRIDSRWIHCSDGDVRLPADYFSCARSRGGEGSECAALVYPYVHCADPDRPADQGMLQATRLYEYSLQYYEAGLRLAGSPYAFQTVGSTIAVDRHGYEKVRGFPRRAAGEDFYLLNKLAKVGRIHRLEAGVDCEPIRIMARASDRVPFGTGAAVRSIGSMDCPVERYTYYHPAVFRLLRAWLASWPSLWALGQHGLDGDRWISRVDGAVSPAESGVLADALLGLGVPAALRHAFRQGRDMRQFRRQLTTWFDAFRTLKLIHRLRDHAFPSVNLHTLVEKPDFVEMLRTDHRWRQYHDRTFPLIDTR